MNQRIRLGIIGLGRPWRKVYRPALLTLSERFAVSAIYDQVRSRASREASRLSCSTAEGPTALLERQDVDAVVLANLQWFGLWPVEPALRLGKPVFCGDVLDCADAHLESLYRKTECASVPVVFPLNFRFEPAGIRLHELCRTELGPPRLVLCDRIGSSPAHTATAVQTTCADSISALIGAAGISCLHYGAQLLRDTPTGASLTGAVEKGFGMISLEYSGGRAVHVAGRRVAGVRASLHLRVITELASVTLESPSHLSWTNREGRHSQHLRVGRPWGEMALEHFWEVVREKAAPVAGLAEAQRISTWLRAAGSNTGNS